MKEAIKWKIFLSKHSNVVRKYKKIKKQQEEEMKQWWDNLLPRKGSLLRQLVDKELLINSNK